MDKIEVAESLRKAKTCMPNQPTINDIALAKGFINDALIALETTKIIRFFGFAIMYESYPIRMKEYEWRKCFSLWWKNRKLASFKIKSKGERWAL